MTHPQALDPIRGDIEIFLGLLFKWSRAVKLTAFGGREEALQAGILPSLEALPFLPPAPFAALDVGSGGGFPAVPLALARRDSAWVLTEPSGRKAAFLREVAHSLGLALDVREETAERALASCNGPFGAVTVRGVRMDRRRAAALASGLAPGGVLLLWTGRDLAAPYGKLLERAGLQASEACPVAEGSFLLRAEKR